MSLVLASCAVAAVLAMACSSPATIKSNINDGVKAAQALEADLAIPVGLTVDMFADAGTINCVVTLRGSDVNEFALGELRRRIDRVLERETGRTVAAMKLVIEYQ